MQEMDFNIEKRAENKLDNKVELNVNCKEEIWLIRESETWLTAGKTH